MAWAPVADEPTVDHDGDVVTQRLCLIHSMGRQNHTRVLEALQHFEQASSRDRVDPGGRLIQELG